MALLAIAATAGLARTAAVPSPAAATGYDFAECTWTSASGRYYNFGSLERSNRDYAIDGVPAGDRGDYVYYLNFCRCAARAARAARAAAAP